MGSVRPPEAPCLSVGLRIRPDSFAANALLHSLDSQHARSLPLLPFSLLRLREPKPSAGS